MARLWKTPEFSSLLPARGTAITRISAQLWNPGGFLIFLCFFSPLHLSLRSVSVWVPPGYHSLAQLEWHFGHCSMTHSALYVLMYFWKQHSGPKFVLFPQPKGFHIQNSQVLFSAMTNSVFSLTAITHKHHLTLSHERIVSYCKYSNTLNSRKWISSSVFTDMGIFFNSYILNTKIGYKQFRSSF